MSAELKTHAWGHIQKMDGWASEDQVVGMIDLVLASKPSILVESGVFGGRSVVAMAMACQSLGHGVVWGIDPWAASAALEGENGKENDEWWASLNLETIYRTFIQNVLALDLTRHLNWLRMKSEQAVKLFDDRSVGILRTDSNHSELISCLEVEMWHNKVAEKGYWIWDDTDWRTQAKALALVRQKGFAVVQDHGKWMVFQRL